MRERHRMTRLIRRGSTSEVYEAVALGESGFERRVAIKLLLPEIALDASAAKRFEEEARIMSRLHHANIAAVIDYGVLEGRPFQVLEFVDGLDLASLVTRGESSKIRASPSIALFIAGELARAIDHAHTGVDPRT